MNKIGTNMKNDRLNDSSGVFVIRINGIVVSVARTH